MKIRRRLSVRDCGHRWGLRATTPARGALHDATHAGEEGGYATARRRWRTRARTQVVAVVPRNPRKRNVIYGAPLDCGALRHAPLNEQGVVFLFAIMAERLGFAVEAIKNTFPDCEGKRRMKSGAWERVRIEFEFESKNFRRHRHNASDCDLIVCWNHNWPDCPVEVLAMRDFVPQREMTKSE